MLFKSVTTGTKPKAFISGKRSFAKKIKMKQETEENADITALSVRKIGTENFLKKVVPQVRWFWYIMEVSSVMFVIKLSD